MRCKKHPADLSAAVGVCATCLRERLLALIAAQVQAQAQAHQPQFPRPTALHDRPKPDHVPPLEFPRSVSPYVTRRKPHDDDPYWAVHHQRFYSTPQVGPTYSAASTAADFETSRSFKRRNKRFSVLSNLFRSRSEKLDSDLRVSCHDPSGESVSSSSSSSWINTIFPVRRRNPHARVFYTAEESGPDHRRSCRRVNRGMSPAREDESDEECDWTPERSSELRKTPVASLRGKAGHGHARQMSGFAFCLSPLVRPSPNRQWNQKVGLAPDLAVSGEIRGPVKPPLATAAAFCANRSRKLADFGRVNHNR